MGVEGKVEGDGCIDEFLVGECSKEEGVGNEGLWRGDRERGVEESAGTVSYGAVDEEMLQRVDVVRGGVCGAAQEAGVVVVGAAGLDWLA